MAETKSGQQRAVGRGATGNPPNRYETTRVEADLEQLDALEDDPIASNRVATQLLPDRSQSIIASNDSPFYVAGRCANLLSGVWAGP